MIKLGVHDPMSTYKVQKCILGLFFIVFGISSRFFHFQFRLCDFGRVFRQFFEFAYWQGTRDVIDF